MNCCSWVPYSRNLLTLNVFPIPKNLPSCFLKAHEFLDQLLQQRALWLRFTSHEGPPSMINFNLAIFKFFLIAKFLYWKKDAFPILLSDSSSYRLLIQSPPLAWGHLYGRLKNVSIQSEAVSYLWSSMLPTFVPSPVLLSLFSRITEIDLGKTLLKL